MFRLLRRFGSHAAAAPSLHEATPSSLSLLSNGLRVATQPHAHNSSLACVAVTLQGGTRYEKRSESGTAHFLEHMIFKGTPSRSRVQFEREVENIGGSINAYTSREITHYSLVVPKHKLEQGVAILSDVLLNPVVDPALVDAEKRTISDEAEFVAKNYEHETLFDLLHSVAFKDQGIGFNILGEDGNHANINREQLIDYKDSIYIAPRMVVSAAGAVTHPEMVALAEKYFSKAPATPVNPEKTILQPARYEGGEVRVYNDDMSHLHAAVAFQGPGIAHADALPLLVIQSMFSTWKKDAPNSEFTANKFGQACLKHGVEGEILIDQVDFFFIPYTDVSLVGFNFKGQPTLGLEEGVYHLMAEVIGVCFEIGDLDFERAKNTLKHAIAAQADGAVSAADDLGKHLVYFGRSVPYEELSKRIDMITKADLKTVAGKYFYDRDPAVAIMGKGVDHFPEYNRMRSWTYWLTS